MQKALDSRQNRSTRLIFHSDWGSQHGSRAFRSVLGRHHMRQSMSARANPHHNACRESAIGRLKAEMVQDGSFETSSDAEIELFAGIDGYCNTRRGHSSIDCTTPASFAADLALPNWNKLGSKNTLHLRMRKQSSQTAIMRQAAERAGYPADGWHPEDTGSPNDKVLGRLNIAPETVAGHVKGALALLYNCFDCCKPKANRQ